MARLNCTKVPKTGIQLEFEPRIRDASTIRRLVIDPA